MGVNLQRETLFGQFKGGRTCEMWSAYVQTDLQKSILLLLNPPLYTVQLSSVHFLKKKQRVWE